MSVSMYHISIPPLVRMLNNLTAFLKKAEAHAEAKKIDPSVFMQGRLAPDMFPLTRQVQIATDMTKGCAARLAGVDIPSYEDKEVTFAELYARIEKTIAFIQGVDAKKVDESAERAIALKVGKHEFSFTGQEYLLNFVFPNVYFHITTTYAILRHMDIEIGKFDFLGTY